MLLGVGYLIAIQTPATMYNHKKNLLVIIFIYVTYAIFISVTKESIGKSFLPVLQVFSVYLLFRNYSAMHLFFRYLKKIFIILIILSIINVTLELIIGDVQKLELISNIEYQEGTYEFDLRFPLTWSSMFMRDSGINFYLPRQYYFFIEPGMVSPFFTMMIYVLWNDETEKNKWIQTIIFVIGILLTFSTGGPLILIISVAVCYLIKNKTKLSLFIIALFTLGVYMAWYAYNYMPLFGRMAKMELSRGSAASIESHESFGLHLIVGVVLIALCGLVFMKTKHNKTLPLVIIACISLGYLSNYIGYTTLATMFLFWDDSPTTKNRFNYVYYRTQTNTLVSSNYLDL